MNKKKTILDAFIISMVILLIAMTMNAQQKPDKKDLAINLLKAQNDYQAAVIDELTEQLKACKPEEKK